MQTANELRNRLIKVAHENPDIRGEVLGLVKEYDQTTVAEFHEILASAPALPNTPLDATLIGLCSGGEREITAKVDRRTVDKMVGMTKQRIKQAVDAYGEATKELKKAEADAKAVLDGIKKLKSVQSAALKPLTEAAKQLQVKGQICLEGQEQALNMTVYIQDKTPGIVQMMAEEDDEALKKGQKAGELFARLVAELGEEAAKTAFTVTQQCREDLTHTATAVTALKLVVKAGDSASGAKQAGVLEAVGQAVDWLHGKANRRMNFGGSIKDWVKGFVMRTKICGKAVQQQSKSFSNAKRKIDALT